jgi:DNA-binding winged helix-turn-helix (wHTH) protein
MTDLEKFQELVLKSESKALREKLKQASDKESFVNTAVELGTKNGYHFTAKEVWAAMEEEKEKAKKRDPSLSDEELNKEFDTFRGEEIIIYLSDDKIRPY